jgi:predicted Zn-dependent peptidase
MLMDVRAGRLGNGVRVVTSAIPRVESVALGIWVGAGSRFERAEWGGISHFIEHLLFKGTRHRTARDISRAIEGRGGYLNAFTQEESTCYYARVACDRLGEALDVLTDMYLCPLFAGEDIAKERGVIVEEIMMYRDQPQHVVQELMTAALWRGHPLGRPVSGSPESLARVNRAALLDYKRAAYVPANTVFAFAGKVSHEPCLRRVQRLFGRLGRRPAPPCARVGERVGQEQVVVENKGIEQTQVALGIRLFGRRDPRRYALRLLNAVLGENMSSRLFQIVREQHGLAYSIHSSYHLFADSGALVVSAGLDRKRSVPALELIVRELARLKESAVGPRDLKRAKDYVLGQLRLGLESTTNQMMWIGDNLISHGRFIPPEEIIGQVERVSAADIRRLAGETLAAARTSLAVVSPDLAARDQPALRKLLGRL